MTKPERMRLAFAAWWERTGRLFAETPSPNEAMRKTMAKFYFENGWKARAAKDQRQAMRRDDEKRAGKTGGPQ